HHTALPSFPTTTLFRSRQGEATSVVHAAKIRLSDAVDARSARQVAEALEVWRDGMSARQAALAVADALEALYTRVGVPTRLRQLDRKSTRLNSSHVAIS